jgi:hypothetical protein
MSGLAQPAKLGAGASAVARIAVASAGAAQVSRVQGAACLLIDASSCGDAEGIQAIADAWATMTAGRPAVLLVTPGDMDRISALARSGFFEAISAVCVGDHQAEIRAAELAALWPHSQDADEGAATRHARHHDEPSVLPRHLRWRQAGEPGRVQLH